MFVIPLKFLPLILIPIFLFYIGVKYFYGYWNRRGIYSPPALFPIGHLGKIAVAGINLGEYFQNWYSLTKNDHRCIGLYMVFKRTLLVNDLDLIKNILVKDYNYFQGHGFKSNKKADPVAQHLFNVDGPEWKEIRDKLSPTFTSSKLRKMVELMTVCAEEMVEYLRLQVGSENILDIKDLMGKYATEVTGSCGFGLQLNSFKYPDTEIRQMSKRALNKNIILAIIDLFAIVAPSLVQNLGLSVNYGDVTRFFCKFVPDAIAQREKTNMQINDFLQVLMKLRDSDKISGHEVVDRLPVLVSGKGVDQLLCIPKLESAEGEKIASAVYESLLSWGLLNKVMSMSFDTTASNTGSRKGACILLEQKMDKEMLWLACRHHIMEIMLESVVQNEIGPSSGPDNSLFKRFQKNWQLINKKEYATLETDEESIEKLQDVKDEIINFAKKQLTEYQPRDDYKELLQLSIVFLGGELKNGVSFKNPAGLHRARWMAKSIYSLKMFLFREQFRLTKQEEKGLREICIFTVLIYIKYWFQAPSACSAPRNDLELLKDLKKYEDVNPVIARKAINKVCGHLWYVSEELIALSFFDDKVRNETKKKMVEALKKEGADFCPKRINVDIDNIGNKNLEDFVTSNTKRFFSITGLSSDFLKKKVEDWIKDKEYIQSKEIVSKFKVVNDTAERGVSLIQEYNKILTLDEDQKQYILLLVKSFRQKFPNYKKATLLSA